MQTFLFSVHMIIVIAMSIVILLQRSESSVLGIGGASGTAVKKRSSPASKLTWALAFLFMLTSLGLSIALPVTTKHKSIIESENIQNNPVQIDANLPELEDAPVNTSETPVFDDELLIDLN